jgi:hypothetical protein
MYGIPAREQLVAWTLAQPSRKEESDLSFMLRLSEHIRVIEPGIEDDDERDDLRGIHRELERQIAEMIAQKYVWNASIQGKGGAFSAAGVK